MFNPENFDIYKKTKEPSPMLNPTEKKLEEIRESRLNILKSSENLPVSVIFGREIRKKLRETTEINGWPKAPDYLKNTKDFFSSVDQTVDEKWQEKAGEDQKSAADLLKEKTEKWLAKLPPEFKRENSDVTELLSDPDELKEKIRLKKFDVLEPLKKFLLDAWETIVMVSSERQLAQIALSKDWLKNMPDKAFENLEFNRAELTLQNDLASLVGKLIDHGYLKQGELNKFLTEENEGETEGVIGKKYVYSLPGKEGGFQPTPFKDVLPFELQRFQKDLEFLSSKTEKLIMEWKLPKSYRSLPDYLRQMAATYNSGETDKTKLYEKWRGLYQTNAELLKSGCPLVINPQEDAPLNIVSLEIRLGFCSQELKDLEKQSSVYTEVAYSLMDEIRHNQPEITSQLPAKIDLFITDQTYAFGPNLQSETLAESYHNQIFLHVNAVEDIAKKIEIPLLKKVFVKGEIDQQEYIRQAILEVARHEVAHQVLASEDEKVMKRIGESPEANILEELKAEAVGMKLIEDELPGLSETESKGILMAKIGTLFNYLVFRGGEEGSEGEDYHLCGVKIVNELLNTGVVKIENNKLTITDAKEGLETIIKIGNQVLDIYKNPDTTPRKVETYVNDLRKIKEASGLKRLIKVLKNK